MLDRTTTVRLYMQRWMRIPSAGTQHHVRRPTFTCPHAHMRRRRRSTTIHNFHLQRSGSGTIPPPSFLIYSTGESRRSHVAESIVNAARFRRRRGVVDSFHHCRLMGADWFRVNVHQPPSLASLHSHLPLTNLTASQNNTFQTTTPPKRTPPTKYTLFV